MKSFPVGAVVAAGVPPDFTAPAGIVHPRLGDPPVRGIFPVHVKDTKAGVEVTEILEDTLSLWTAGPRSLCVRGTS